MTLRVMVVDDSAVIRGMITRGLERDPDIKVISSAGDGNMAITFARQQAPDVIILDVEMPGMDGLTALPQLLKEAPKARVIMCSTLTQRNAGISLEAMAKGAADYIPKPTAVSNKEDGQDFHRELRDKVRALGGLPIGGELPAHPAPASAPAAASTYVPKSTSTNISLLPATSARVHALAVASSTGGPQALLNVFQGLRAHLRQIPVFITQHMPPTFTTLLAEQIARVADRPCAEARHGEVVQSGHIYLAPGDYHMTVRKSGVQLTLNLDQNPPVNFCRPAADPMLDSLVEAYGDALLVAVLTGMGADGMEGARRAVQAGAAVIAQDEATSVVWGMPRAVAENKLCQAVLPLGEIAPFIIKRCG